VGLFSRTKALAVQNFILKIINNNCSELKAYFEGPRRDNRVNLCLVVLVAPLEHEKILIDETFYAVTKEFSVNGVGIILDKQRALDKVILGFSSEGDMTYFRAKAKHLSPMGGGFYHLGLEMTELVPNSHYPQLEALKF
jgi:hypothetical protein